MKYRIVKGHGQRWPYYKVQRKVWNLFWWDISFPTTNGTLLPERFYDYGFKDGGYEAAKRAMFRHMNGRREGSDVVMCEVELSNDVEATR